MHKLAKLSNYGGPEGPVVLAIMDGVGLGKGDAGDMVAKASTPHLDALMANSPYTRLKAHGSAVGMPTESDMGNSEVGHNAIGAGRVFRQGATLVQQAIESGALYEGETWKECTGGCIENKSALHFIGLLSDGNVHTHIDHLFAMLRQAAAEGVQIVRIHTLLDGRDVPPRSAHEYIEKLEAVLAELNKGGVDYAIASGGGRLYITMDRYGADWDMVERGWNVHVRGQGRTFDSALGAVETLRRETPGVIDQDLKEFVIVRDGKPLGPIVDGDSVIVFNFRGDRAMEISRALQEENFDKFDRSPMPDILFAGMMEYDAETRVPRKYLVVPPAIDETVGEYLATTGVRQLAISETQKFGHVTYFFNGNRTGKFSEALEEYVEIPSDRVSFDERPWMKAAEITDVVLDAVRNGKHDFIRLNFPNGDMVGHTGDLLAVEIAVEATDLCVGRLMKAVAAAKGILVVTADHGNADEMYEVGKDGRLKLDADGEPRSKTAHTLNPVPCCIYDPTNQANLKMANVENPGIASLAATCVMLLGYEPPANYDPSLVEVG